MMHLSRRPLSIRNRTMTKVTFCNSAEPLHCKSSVNDTVYTKVFMEPSLTSYQLAIIEKLFFNVLHIKCKNEHLDSFRVVNLAFWYLLFFYRTRYHGLPWVIIRIAIQITILLWKFCTAFISYYFQHITRSVAECPIHFQ